MTEDHANMPGMGEQTKQPEPGRADAAPQKARRPGKPDAPEPKPDGAKPKATPEQS